MSCSTKFCADCLAKRRADCLSQQRYHSLSKSRADCISNYCLTKCCALSDYRTYVCLQSYTGRASLQFKQIKV